MFRLLLAQAAGGGGGDVTTGMFWWYDAQALSGYANGDPVASWPDSSGNSRTATQDQGTSAWQPTYTTGAIHTHPAVRFQSFGGNGRGFSMPGTFNPSEAHLFIVARPESNSPPYHIGSISFGPTFPATVDGTGTITDHFGSNSSRSVGAAGVDTTAGFIYHAHAASGLWEAHVGNSLLYTNATNTVTWGVQKLGAYLSGGSFNTEFLGYIGEFRVYDSALTGTQVTNITNALGTKWGITP